MNVRNRPIVWAIGAALLCAALSPVFVLAKGGKKKKGPRVVQLGPRPYYLVNDMEPSPLKEKLVSCMDDRSSTTDFSIGHRGACLQFPEHTKESFEAAARMGAGIIECDVTFTSDFELVCRHAQCDLHTTTNILATPLADTCRKPFEPAEFDENGERTKEATAECCTSDITYEEFKTLCGKMDAADTNATTVEEYLGGTASWRTDLYSSCATLMSHADSIELIDSYGLKFTPELKSPQVEMPFEADDGTLYTQEDYAEKMIQEYRDAEIAPSRVWAQSFNLEDVIYWVEEAPEYGDQAVFLENRYYGDLDANDPSTWEFPEPQDVRDLGVQWYAPPMQNLLTSEDGNVVPNELAKASGDAGLKIITWTIERAAPLSGNQGSPGFYYNSILEVVDNDGDLYEVLDVLAQDVGIEGIFTDWPATVTYYANCMGL